MRGRSTVIHAKTLIDELIANYAANRNPIG